MKVTILMILGFTLTSISFAAEIKEYSAHFCGAKDNIADFYHSGTFGLTKEEYKAFKLTADRVDSKISELCDSKKDPNTILDALNDVCSDQVQKNSSISEKLKKYSSESPCSEFYSKTIIWYMGFADGIKSKDGEKCEDKNSISTISRAAQKIADKVETNKAPESSIVPK
ncbi:MAG: hypothetical protein K2Q18_15460 [Bdellovibrionales bacterium]|nr:hypothetical protein [Bdellovibrionales bacterium]